MRSPHLKQIVELVARGEVSSRADLARTLGVAPSTVSLYVQELTRQGLIREEGEGPSSGGRRPRMLRPREDGAVLAAELGAHHARLGRLSMSANLLESHCLDLAISDGPEAVLPLIVDELRRISRGTAIRAVGLALPGPVDRESGRVVQPARMPGWHGFGVRDWVAEQLGVPVMVGNDANLMALGEHRDQLGAAGHSITVKAGTSIGSGVVIAGALYFGASGGVGELAHTRVEIAGDRPCTCGNTGCLETVASGESLLQELKSRGVEVRTTSDIVQLTRDGDRETTTLVRAAGSYYGQVLAGVVNMLNPDAVFLGGVMGSCEPFIAAVRSRVYEGCHPLVTRKLRVEPTLTGPDAALLGAAHATLDQFYETTMTVG